MKRDDVHNILDDELSLTELLKALRINKKFILILTGIFSVFSGVYSLHLTNIYTSQALLVPTYLSTSNSKIDQYNNFASIAGIDLNGKSPDVTVALAFINSKKIISQLAKHDTFLPDLMAAKKWDMNSNSVIYDEHIYDSKDKKWIREVNFPLQQIPSEQEAFGLFSKHININIDKKNDLITLSVDHISPLIAQQWSAWIIDEANSMVANLRIDEAERSINYLNNQIKHTPYSELKTLFFNLIQKKTQDMMLANANKQYALTIIDPPLVAEKKSKPKRLFIFIVGTLLGFILSILIIILRKYGFNKEDKLNIL